MRQCSKCNEYKSLPDFAVRSGGSYRYECKDCTSEWQRRYRAENKSKIKKQATMRRYNLTESQYNEIQSIDRCEICSKKVTDTTRRADSKNIDHCHETGEVRGVLCFHCNTAIGLFKDDVKLISKSIEYLSKYV
jgi:hypothetical protein